MGLMLISWYVSIYYLTSNHLQECIRTSATNGARVYNTCLSRPNQQPEKWFSFDLRTEHVWDGFCLLSLLEDHVKHDSILTMLHSGLQKDQFKEAMKVRNLRVQQAGQEEYAHACKKCVQMWDTKDRHPAGKSSCDVWSFHELIRYVLEKCSVLVIDRITIGHPCCGILHCTIALANNRHHYCPDHKGHHHICCVEGCLLPVASSAEGDPTRMTCDELHHAALEQ